MASWLIRMDSSSGKSRVIRRAICSGLHAVTQARSPRWGLLRAFHCVPAGPAATWPSAPRTTPESLSWTYWRSLSLLTSLAVFGGLARALSRYLKYVVAQLIVELWRWISVGALV